ncbi:hypothetical protein L2E82_03355 [Cichorium intybus]|uniref:Uncharacterized protein n=1 Tax=Cichorium intybus TaxID=13427 RepID=A0ACB9H4W6_CICIN|nr:hypothetical protein L2E82_03355 [Cichorium intybus]
MLVGSWTIEILFFFFGCNKTCFCGVMTFFFPSCFVDIVCYSTFWFDYHVLKLFLFSVCILFMEYDLVFIICYPVVSLEGHSMSLRRPPLPRLLLNNVSCMRNAQQILRHTNISIHDGGALVLTGANGSGKSTFLRMLAGFSKPSAGEILWNGHDITESGVFHQYKLQLNWLSLKEAIKSNFTVLDNVQWFEVLESKQGKSLPALEFMGLGRLANEKARMLSMGQRKRLQLARVMAMDRPIWLLDEPSVALDDEGVKLLEQMIADHRSQGGIVIVATHLPIDIQDAMILRLPPRFPRRITLVDMLPH